MTDGTLSVRRRQPKESELAADQPYSTANLRSGAYEAFLGASVPAIGMGSFKAKTKPKAIPDSSELKVESGRTQRLKEYDRFLKSFKYSAALDSVLKKVG
jgi:U3 small nucleolar RNA-associated protein 15